MVNGTPEHPKSPTHDTLDCRTGLSTRDLPPAHRHARHTPGGTGNGAGHGDASHNTPDCDTARASRTTQARNRRNHARHADARPISNMLYGTRQACELRPAYINEAR